MAEACITFAGGAHSPTGAHYLVDVEGTPSFMVDCGLKQGCRLCEDDNRGSFTGNVSAYQYLFVTHAHIDHVGRIPKLVREGFRGKIISTPPTKDIAEVMLRDSLRILEREAKREGTRLLFDRYDISRALSVWETREYHDPVRTGGLEVYFADAGHILGSAMVVARAFGKQIVFTGDLGNTPAPLLGETEHVPGTHVLVLESVYGDREHEDVRDRRALLEDAVEKTASRGGVLMIPAFSLERTQALLYELGRLREEKSIPEIPIFVDSPLAIDLIKVYEKHARFMKHDVTESRDLGEAIFRFPGVRFTYTSRESAAIKKEPNPKIIIAGSGMSNGGRILFHEKEYLGDGKNILLIIGYQVPGSLGRALQDDAREVEISGERVAVRADVVTIRGYSAHKDSEGLLAFAAESADSLKDVFVVQGEPKASLFLAQRLRDYLGLRASVPNPGERICITL